MEDELRRILFGILAGALALTSLPSMGSAAPIDQATPTAGQTPAAGQAPAPAGQAPALLIQSDLTIGQPGPCTLQSRFAPGDRVIFRAKVYDAQTGQQVIDGNVNIRIEGGPTIPMRYGPHPPPEVAPSTDEYWVGVWAIPPSTPMGIVHYTIEAVSGTRMGTFVPFNNATSLLTVVPPSS